MPGCHRQHAQVSLSSSCHSSKKLRARQHGSVDGALRSAEAFRTLGHVALVEQCFHIAAELAASDEDALRKVRDARERWATLQTFEDF